MWELYDYELDISTDAIPGKYIATIALDGEEVAVIVHRENGGQFPIDGPCAAQKLERAARMVKILNESGYGLDTDN